MRNEDQKLKERKKKKQNKKKRGKGKKNKQKNKQTKKKNRVRWRKKNTWQRNMTPPATNTRSKTSYACDNTMFLFLAP